MKKLILVAVLAVFAVGCGRDYPLSSLDNKPMVPNSIHSAHVTALTEYGDFQLDNGVQIKLFLTGGSGPHLDRGATGTIVVSVPGYEEDHDADSTYYFQKFMPDTPSQMEIYGCDPIDGCTNMIFITPQPHYQILVRNRNSEE